MTWLTGNKESKAESSSALHAFTLVELMLVMTLLIIVIAIAAPTLSSFFRGRTLDSEARRLLALTRMGQSRAISEGMPMLLWIDERERKYGVEEEASYTDQDKRAVEYTLDKDLELQIVQDQFDIFAQERQQLPLAPLQINPNSINARAAAAQSARKSNPRRNLPAIRFQPDGTFGENSPQTLRLAGKDGEEMWLTQSRNRLNYEIRRQTNQWARR